MDLDFNSYDNFVCIKLAQYIVSQTILDKKKNRKSLMDLKTKPEDDRLSV